MPTKNVEVAAPTRRRRASSFVKGAARRHYASRGGVKGIVGSFSPMLHGAAGQVAASLGKQFGGPWGGVIGLAGAGYLTKNDTLKTIAGMHAAAQFPIASMLGGLAGGSSASNGTAI